MPALARHVAVLLAFATALALPATGSAATRSVRASATAGRMLTFAVRGTAPASIVRAELRSAGRVRRLSVSDVRRGVRRGTVRVKMSPAAHRRLRHLSGARRRRFLRGQVLVLHLTGGGRPGDVQAAPVAADAQPGTPSAAGAEGAATTVASSEAIPASARYVAPYGDDAAAGTADAPWRTLARAVSAVRPGDTVVLRSGVYGARGTVNLMNRAGTASAPISFRGEPGEPMPTILGFFKITGGHQHFDHLLFDGPTGPVQAATADNPRGEEVQVSVIGTAVDGVEITGSEIRDSAWHAGIFLSHANDVRVVGNYIHDNGDASDPGQANLSHGIYWSSGSGVIANNVVEHNLARGIQLYQSPSDARVVNNTVVGNGKAGIQFGDATARVTAANNVVVGNEYGIRSAGLTGTGNIARDNLLWANARGDLALADGLALSGNLIADPLFQGATDYRLTSPSPAVDRASAAFAPPADIGNRPRPLGAAPDLGAYESH